MTGAGHNSSTAFDWFVRGLALSSALLAYSLVLGDHSLPQLLMLEASLRDRSAEAFERMARNQSLEARLEGLKHDDRVLEEEARSSLDLVHPDEVVFIVRPRSEPAPAPDPPRK